MGSVVVVGGGVAGLACAWKLRRSGHEVEVLERDVAAGGRMRTELHQGFQIERGAQLVASGSRNLQAAAAALGIGARLQDLPDTREAVLHGGRLHAWDWSAPRSVLTSDLLSTTAKLRLLRLPAALLRRARRLDPLRPETAAALDRDDLATGMRRLVGVEASELLLLPAFSATFDAEPEDLSYAFALLALLGLTAGARLQSFEGGNGLLTRSLAQRVPLRTGCQVISVETETDGARVRYRTQGRERSVLADAAVVALPGSRVAAVCPKLTPEERGFFDEVHYGRGTIVHLLLEAPPARLAAQGVSFPRREGLELYGLAADHHKPGAAPSGAGLLNVALRARAAARLWEAPDAAVVELALENLSRTPVGRLRPLHAVVHRWDPMLPLFRPGHIARLARFHRRMERSPRLAFAGDYLIAPTVEAAFTSGMRAATEVVRGL